MDLEAESSVKAQKYRPLIATSIGHFTNDGTVFLVPVIIDLLAVTSHVSAFLITASLTLFYLSMALSANLMGPLIERRSLQAQGMFAGILILSLGLLLFSVALDGILVPLFLLLSSVITGFGGSFYHPTGSAIIQSHYKGQKLGRYLGVNGSSGSFGRAIYPSLIFLVGLAFTSNVSSALFFGTVGIVLSFVIFLIMGIPGSRKVSSQHDAKKAIGEESENGKKKLTAIRAISSSVALLAIISLIRSIAFTGIVSWIPEYISFERGVGAGISLGTTMTMMFSGGIVGQLVFGKLVETHDKRFILMVNIVISAVLMFLYIDTSGLLSLSFLILFGFVNFSGFPIFMSMISDYVPRGSTTTSNALVWNLGGTGGQTIGPLIIGLAIGGNYASLPSVFEVLLVLGVISAVATLVLPKPAKISKAPLFA